MGENPAFNSGPGQIAVDPTGEISNNGTFQSVTGSGENSFQLQGDHVGEQLAAQFQSQDFPAAGVVPGASEFSQNSF